MSEEIKLAPPDAGSDRATDGSAGFTLIETVFALVIIMIALLGVAQAFTYAVLYNSGNAARSQSLAILQQEVELLRAAKWTSAGLDPLLASGDAAPVYRNAPNGGTFRIDKRVDDDPFTDGVQNDPTSQLKEVTMTVSVAYTVPGWQTAVPITMRMRRTRGN